jgi:hypothetical protein
MRCEHGTDGDGDCMLCARQGGCPLHRTSPLLWEPREQRGPRILQFPTEPPASDAGSFADVFSFLFWVAFAVFALAAAATAIVNAFVFLFRG